MQVLLSKIPENGKFQVASSYTIGGGACQVTLLPDQVYGVEQSLVGLVLAEGVCHIQQQSKAFGDVNRLQDIAFTVDPDLMVLAI